MKLSLRHLVALSALLILVPALAACGLNAQTDKVYQPAIGTDVRGENVDVLGAVIVSTEDGTGQLVISLNNNSLNDSDKLVKISGDDLTIAAASVEVPANKLINLADQPFEVTGDDIEAGDFVKLTFDFQSGESLVAEVPVVTNAAPYDNITPASPSTSPHKSASPSATPAE
ncbi:MAG TPA: hypothetical protein P5108_03795 [Marmoricola sp.]|nr:hypothetical protein [Nocardioidaceae bacterium]MCB8993584.1 hypothetical protein [Nocardioidaceae bacterium]MCO5323396.1 hypothetical protein [Nocardioidaceae bacterium]HRV68551.1 hypothetical protein [Marmoricola sp.]